MSKQFTVEDIQEAVDVAVGGANYGKAYRAFKYALEEAHAVLTLDDIVELITNADEEFAENHRCTCGGCDSVENAVPSAVN